MNQVEHICGVVIFFKLAAHTDTHSDTRTNTIKDVMILSTQKKKIILLL